MFRAVVDQGCEPVVETFVRTAVLVVVLLAWVLFVLSLLDIKN